MLYRDYLKSKYQNTAFKLANAEGVPCVLEYSKGKNIRNYEIYGNSYQATRSGKNLFDKSLSTVTDIVNETTITSRSYSLPILKVNDICNILKPNTTYTISCEFECTAIPSEDDGYTYSAGILGFIIYTKVSGYSIINIHIDKQMSVGEVYQFSKTFKTPETFDSNGNYSLLIYRNKYTGKSTIGASMICRNIQIEEGSTATEYEPYRVSPSPDCPSEVHSVGDLTNKNLFDIDAFLALNDNSAYYSKNENGELVQLKPDYRTDTSLFNYVTLSAGNYIISYSNTEVTKYQTYVNGVSKSKTRNFTLTETSTVGFKFYESAGTVLGHIQIEEGSTDTEYEPYHKYGIPIMVTGKNLFNKEACHCYEIKLEPPTVININNYAAGVLWSDQLISLFKPNTTYTISCEFECVDVPSDDYTFNSGIFGFLIQTKVSGYSSISMLVTHQLVKGEIYHFSKTFTVPSNFSEGTYTMYVYRNSYKNSDGKIRTASVICRNIQIEEGSSSTAYEPYKGSETTHIYLDEPLRKVGDYADYIDFKNQKVVRNVKEITLNGSENWRLQGINENGIISFLYTLSTESTTSTTNVSALSSHYSYKIVSLSNAIEQGFFIQRGPGATNIYIRMLNEEIADITAFKTLLSENNVTVYYQMATPIEENIPLPALKTFKGTSIMSVDTAVLPSNIKAKYIRT